MILVASTASAIIRVAWTSIAATVLVSLLFSGGVVGLIRASELRRESRGPAATACTAAATLALLICLAAVAYGVILVGQKS